MLYWFRAAVKNPVPEDPSVFTVLCLGQVRKGHPITLTVTVKNMLCLGSVHLVEIFKLATKFQPLRAQSSVDDQVFI